MAEIMTVLAVWTLGSFGLALIVGPMLAASRHGLEEVGMAEVVQIQRL